MAKTNLVGSKEALINDARTKLILKLIDENRLLLVELDRFQKKTKTENERIKRDAAEIMDRLVSENGLYRAKLQNLQQQLEKSERLQKEARETILVSRQAKIALDREKEVLTNHVLNLKERQAHLEYETKHIGAAFLALRETVIQFVANPISLEAQTTETAWEDRVTTSTFQAAVIDTVQHTARLQSVLEAVDTKLVNLKLLDPRTSFAVLKRTKLSHSGSAPLYLMGEKLVPYKDLAAARSERQVWQRRYLKIQEDVLLQKLKIEELEKECTNKASLIKKLQTQKSVIGKVSDAWKNPQAKQLKVLTDELAQLKAQYDSMKQQLKHSTITYKMPATSRQTMSGEKTHADDFLRATPSRSPSELSSSFLMPSSSREPSLDRLPTPRSSQLVPRKTISLTTRKSMQTLDPKPFGFSNKPVKSLIIPKQYDTLPASPTESLRSIDSLQHRTSARRIGTTVNLAGYTSPLAREAAAFHSKNQMRRSVTSVTPRMHTERMASSFLSGKSGSAHHELALAKDQTRFDTLDATQRMASANAFLAGGSTARSATSQILQSPGSVRSLKTVQLAGPRSSLPSMMDSQPEDHQRKDSSTSLRSNSFRAIKIAKSLVLKNITSPFKQNESPPMTFIQQLHLKRKGPPKSNEEPIILDGQPKKQQTPESALTAPKSLKKPLPKTVPKKNSSSEDNPRTNSINSENLEKKIAEVLFKNLKDGLVKSDDLKEVLKVV